MSDNENCLEGMRCPKCGQADHFNFAVRAYAEVTDEGTGDIDDIEWNDDSPAGCRDPDCG